MAQSKKKPLPEAGAAFVFRLEDGRYGVCRVIRQAHGNDIRFLGGPAVLVATSAWIGKSIPDPAAPALRPILQITRHNPKGEPEVMWTDDPIPRKFKSLGIIAPTAEERKIKCNSLSGWESSPIMLMCQWRWDHDRKSLLAEEAVEEQKEVEELKARNEAIERARRSMTLDQLSRRRFFANWKEYPLKAATQACRTIMKDTVQTLATLGPSALKAKRKAVLKACILEFNKLDRAMNRFIETSERDDICSEFELLVHACGLGEYDNLADEWRDW